MEEELGTWISMGEENLSQLTSFLSFVFLAISLSTFNMSKNNFISRFTIRMTSFHVSQELHFTFYRSFTLRFTKASSHVLQDLHFTIQRSLILSSSFHISLSRQLHSTCGTNFASNLRRRMHICNTSNLCRKVASIIITQRNEF